MLRPALATATFIDTQFGDRHRRRAPDGAGPRLHRATRIIVGHRRVLLGALGRYRMDESISARRRLSTRHQSDGGPASGVIADALMVDVDGAFAPVRAVTGRSRSPLRFGEWAPRWGLWSD